MMDSKILDDDIFAFFMSMNPEKEDSEVTFGRYDESKIDKNRNNVEIEWHDVRDKLFFSLQLDDV